MSKLCESLQTLLFFSYFFVISQKKTRKINRFRPSNKKIQTTECHARNSDRICFNILYTELKMNQSPSPQFQNQSPPPSALCSFLKIGRIDKVVNKHTADYQLSDFYGLLSTLSLQSIFFSKPVYSTVVAENFQIYSDTITANKFYKSSFFNFSHALKQNSSPRILSLYSKSERNCPFLLNSIF